MYIANCHQLIKYKQQTMRFQNAIVQVINIKNKIIKILKQHNGYWLICQKF